MTRTIPARAACSSEDSLSEEGGLVLCAESVPGTSGREPEQRLSWVSKDLWGLSFSTFLITCSASMLFGISPLFLTVVLEANKADVGLLEAISEPVSLLTKFLSGAASDYFRNRKSVIAVGYFLTIIAKPFFALATGAGAVGVSKCIERLGNGFLASPRDALTGELAPKARRGEAFALVTALKTLGGALGPVLMFGALYLIGQRAGGEEYRLAIWVGMIPTVFAFFILWRYVRDPDFSVEIAMVKKKLNLHTDRHPVNMQEVRRIRPGYWVIMFISVIFMASRFSEAFLILFFHEVLGADGATSLLIGLGLMNFASAISASWVGWLSQRFPNGLLLILGFLCYVCANIVLMSAEGYAVGICGVILWGIQRGATQTLISAMLAAEVPHDLFGTAFGIFHILSGVVLIPTSFAAGHLSDQFGFSAFFMFGGVIALVATILLICYQLWRWWYPSAPDIPEMC